MDSTTNVAKLKKLMEDFVQERDWAQFHTPKDLSIALAIEAAELMEIFQWKEQKNAVDIKSDENTMAKIREELADVILYSLAIANRLDIDVSSAVEQKMVRNKQKYPIEKAKGTAKKYTEL
ncbi:MAG: nucleotide pyrophosphohydrolase [Candidatus Micrarchaeota archaeon]|nr:nucleotide pyrophosphohydrolase [Candidatus Micrarchaeota archaeon]